MSRTLVGDLDGDGDTDVFNQAVNELYVQAGTAPGLVATTPAPGATDVDGAADLGLTFDEPVVPGSGTVVVRDAATGALVARVDVVADAARITGAGTTALTVDLPASFPAGVLLAVLVDLRPAPGAGSSVGPAPATNSDSTRPVSSGTVAGPH